MTWTLTRSARRINLARIRPSDVCIEDVAYALARINRFNGHAARPYSVAEHSLLVAEILERDGGVRDASLLRAALLHDAHEAYLGDISTPLKGLMGDRFRAVESGAQRAVADHFGLLRAQREHWIAIKHADRVALATERRDLMPEHADPWPAIEDAQPVGWIDLRDREGMGYDDWELAFLDRHAEFAHRLEAVEHNVGANRAAEGGPVERPVRPHPSEASN